MTNPDPSNRYIQPDLSLTGEEHVRRYQETDGVVGHEWNGVTTLLLTTIGRRSGEPRIQPMIYGRDGDNCIVIASKGGAPDHPLWYLNLMAQPKAEVQVKADRFAAVARTAERERLWKMMTKAWPNFDMYQERTERLIPVVVLERVKS